MATLQLVKPPEKKIYFLNETVETDGMILRGILDNYADITFTSGYEVTPKKITTPGTQDIKITAMGKTVTYSIFAYDVNGDDIKLPFEDCPWSTISALANAGLLLNFYNLGDTKTITLNGDVFDCDMLKFNNFKVKACLIGYNHNADLEGKNLAHFLLGFSEDNEYICFSETLNKEYLKDAEGHYINPIGHLTMNLFSEINNLENFFVCKFTGGWESSYMRTTILGNDGIHTPLDPLAHSFMAVLPEELRMYMKPCNKYTDNVVDERSDPEDVTPTVDYLTLLSCTEWRNDDMYQNRAEMDCQKVYQYFYESFVYENKQLKIYRHYDTTRKQANGYSFLRSPCYDSDSNVHIIEPTGYEYWAEPGYIMGIMPIFFI